MMDTWDLLILGVGRYGHPIADTYAAYALYGFIGRPSPSYSSLLSR